MRGRGRVVGSSLCKHAGMEDKMVVVVVEFNIFQINNYCWLSGPPRCLQNRVFYNGICFFCFRYSTPLVSFRVARIWSFVVVTVSRERCRHLQNRIFIFYCILQGGWFWFFARSRLFFDFLFLFFHPSQLLFVFFFFVEAVCVFLLCVFNPSRLFFVSFFSFFDPSRLFFVFSFFYASKGLPPWSGRKIDFLHIQT